MNTQISQRSFRKLPGVARVVVGLFCGMVLLSITVDAGSFTAPSAKTVLSDLQPGHPRLLLNEEQWSQLKQRLEKDPHLARWYRVIRQQAVKLLDAPVSRYEIPDGLRLLGVSRKVLKRVYTLSLVARLEHDQAFAQRAWMELQAAARFPDWNPRHFLDTAEMTHAFAIGYDWLFDDWTMDQKLVLREAIVEKGLKPALAAYRGESRHGWWAKSRHNWNQVCNGGISVGALAVADDVPDLSGQLLHLAIKSIPLAMHEYAPDGAWAEGPGYWNYATSYNVLYLAALQSALGTDYGLSDLEGFDESGMFPVYLSGPLGRTFNYADGGDRLIRAPHLFWLANRYDTPAYAMYQVDAADPHPLDLVWFNPDDVLPYASVLDLDKYFRGAEVVTMRSGWIGRHRLFVGFKGGDNQANHSNLDLGTFVFDALGQRWALDLGADNYNLPGYFGSKRWSYYRMRAEGHNTLVLNPGMGPDQDPSAKARVVRFDATNTGMALAVADLTQAYAAHAQRVHRGMKLLQRKTLLIQDEVDSREMVELWWFMHTRADIDVKGRTAWLTRGGQKLKATILEPADALFASGPAVPLPGSPQLAGQHANAGVNKLKVHLRGNGTMRLVVLLAPWSGQDIQDGENQPVVPLASW